MIRKVLSLVALLIGGFAGVQAQYPLVTVQDIQTVPPATLSACRDSSTLTGDTVRIHAVVVSNPDSAAFTTATRGQMWVRNGYGANSGLDIIQFVDPNTTGMASLEVGDSVELTGVVTEFGPSETELILLDNSTINILNAGANVQATLTTVGELNDNSQANILTTGEKWEGQYIELRDLTVVSVDPFSGGTRVSFVVQDLSGNRINVTDKFKAQRLPPVGTFVAPNVGDTYNYIRGIITHSPNGCTGSNGRGYELSPLYRADYNLASAAPSIIIVSRNTVTPTSSQSVVVSADISDLTQNVASATLYYAVGEATPTYTAVSMTLSTGTNQSGTWTGTIPAQGNGSFVKYYVCATDNNNNTSCNRPVPTGSDPFFYTVRDNGTTIYDVQYVPQAFAGTGSGYVGMGVTVEGVVTASAESNNLGFVFIQEEGQLAWAGIMLTDNPSLATLTVGQKVRVTGTVRESFGFTRIEQVSAIQSVGTGSITALVQNPSNFTYYDTLLNEPYEGMLIELKNPSPTGCIYVVDQNPDAPSNFAEYRVGTDLFNTTDGCRVLAGRVTNSAYSSLNVSYVNDPQWATVDGIMNVPVIVVQPGDNYASLEGIIVYTFGNMKILPRNNDDFNFNANCAVSILEGSKGKVTLYPNPFSANFSIGYEFAGSVRGTAVVYDIMGRTQMQIELNGMTGVQEVSASNLAEGQYIMKVTNDLGEVVEVVKFARMR